MISKNVFSLSTLINDESGLGPCIDIYSLTKIISIINNTNNSNTTNWDLLNEKRFASVIKSVN